MMAMEQEVFLGFSWRWRNIPKPLIAEVQGRVIAGGLMLMWPCDLVVASEDATFTDPVVAREELTEATMAMARKVAMRSSFALMTAKQSVNQALEAQGMLNAIKSAYSLHILGHTHSMQVFGQPYDPAGPEILRAQAKDAASANRTQAKDR